MIKVVIALLVIVILLALILKGYHCRTRAFIAWLTLMICTGFTGWGTVLPKGVSGTGISFSLILSEVMRNLFSTCAADLGLMIMTLMGFCALHGPYIGVNEAVVVVVTRPLRTLRLHILLFSLIFRQSSSTGYPLSYRTCCFTDGNHAFLLCSDSGCQQRPPNR